MQTLRARGRSSFALMGLMLLLQVVFALPALAGQEIILRVGESKTIFLGKIKNVEVGNPGVIDVQEHPDGDKIIVFGVREGYSSLTVGTIAYDINVVGDIERLRKDIETLLIDIPGVDVLSSGTKVVVDGVVKRRDDMERIERLVESNKGEVYSLVLLDERDIVRKAQVQLHFQVLEVSRSRDHDIGIDWTAGPVRLVMDTMSWIQFGPGDIVNSVTGAIRSPDDYVQLGSSVDIRRVLDKDFFTTVSGDEVSFFRGKELIFQVASVQQAALIIKKVGLEVKTRPVIDDDGDIDMTVTLNFSTLGELEYGDIPSISTSEHTAHIQLKEGESFAMSGFFRREKGRNISGIPGLKDIPGLGLLFGTRRWEKGETDGIIVITPTLLDPERRNMRKQIKETLDIYDAADVKW